MMDFLGELVASASFALATAMLISILSEDR